MNRKIDEQLVNKARLYWTRNIKTSFLTFLAWKLVGIKIETPIYMGKDQYNLFIKRFLTDNGRIFNPCTNKYPLKPNFYYSSLSSYTRYIHFEWFDPNQQRGYYKLPESYIVDVKESYITDKLNLEYVSIWLLRNELWDDKTDIDLVINNFILTFNLSTEELDKLFTRQNDIQISFERFYYKRIESNDGSNQLVLPIACDFAELETPGRKESIEYRIIRDTFVSFSVKQIYDFKCQLCGKGIMLSNKNKYAEAHHIMPLGRQHKGPDVTENILCVCPNCHVLLDYGAIELRIENIKVNPKHNISKEAIHYHNKHIYKE